MSTVRQEQVNSVIQRTLGEIILEEMEFSQDVLVTITRVDVSPSLEDADIYIDVLPVIKNEEIIKLLNKNIYHLQKQLDKKVVLKFVPKIKFVIDGQQEITKEVNEILDKI